MENGMDFYKNLYMDETLKNPNKIKRKLAYGKFMPGIYVLAWSSGLNRLELYTSAMLLQWYYKENPPCIVGIASGQETGISMIQQIAEESLDTLGRVDFAAYLFGNGQ